MASPWLLWVLVSFWVSVSVRVLTSWLLTTYEWALYRHVAGVKPNNLLQTELESVQWLWSNLQSSKIPPACYLGPLPQKTAKAWVLMPQGRTLYRRVAGVKPNNLLQTE